MLEGRRNKFWNKKSRKEAGTKLKGQYRHDQQGMESRVLVLDYLGDWKYITPHDKVILSLQLHKWASNFQSLCSS